MTDQERRRTLLQLANKQSSRLLARVFTEIAVDATPDELHYFDRLINRAGRTRRRAARDGNRETPRAEGLT